MKLFIKQIDKTFAPYKSLLMCLLPDDEDKAIVMYSQHFSGWGYMERNFSRSRIDYPNYFGDEL